MKITRKTPSDSPLDSARVAPFLDVFVRRPVTPRQRNIRGR